MISRSLVLSDLLDPIARCFTPEVAERIAKLEVNSQVQERVDELARKSALGALSHEEHSEYEEYVEAADVFGILQAKARAVLTSNR